MYPRRVVNLAKRLSRFAAEEFPDLEESDFRVEIAAALHKVLNEDRAIEALFEPHESAYGEKDDDLI